MNWIPIDEKLPNDGQEVLITVWEDWSYGKGTKIEYHVDYAIYVYDGHFRVCGGRGGFNTMKPVVHGQPCKIIAWMPLPEPYRDPYPPMIDYNGDGRRRIL